MDVGWKRAHLLLFFVTFWKPVVGQGLGFESIDPRSLGFHKTYSPQAVQSSMLNASVTGNIPLEEVDSNVVAGNGTSPSRSRFSYLQFVKGGAPSSYASVSQAQSASSDSVSTSLNVPQNLSQPGSFSNLFQVQGSSLNVKDMAGQSVSSTGYNQYNSTSKDSPGLKTGGFSQLVSSTGGSGLSQSSFSQSAPGSFSALSYSPTFLSQSGSKSLNTSSQSSSGTHMGVMSSWLFTSSQGSSRPQLIGSSSPLVSTQGGSASFSGSYQQSPSKSQSFPKYSSHGSLPLAVSRYPTSSQSLYSSGSRGSSSYQLAASIPSGLAPGSSSQPGVSYVQSQGSLSQVAIGSPQIGSASLAAPPVPQKWLPSASSFSPGSQTSGSGFLSQSSYSPQSAPAPRKPLSSVGLPSQVAPGLLSSVSMASPQSVLCQCNKATEDVNSLSLHQPLQRLQPSVSLSSPSIQTSSSVPLQSSSPFDAVKTPSSFFPSSAGGPSPLVSTQGAGSYSGSPLTPGSSVYSKLVSSPLGASSQFSSAQSSRDLSTSSLQSRVGTAQTVSSRYTSAQIGSSSTFSSSLQPQVGSSQYGPTPSLDAEVLVYSQAPPAGTIYRRQPSRFLQPSISKGTDGSFSTSGAAVLQSSSSSQSVQAPSRSSSSGAASYPVSTQGSGSGLSLSPSTVLQYAPASGMFGSPPLSVSSKSASGQSSPSQYTSLSQSRTGSILTSSGSLSAPGGSGSSDGSSLLAQGTFGKYTPVASMDTRMPVFSQTKAVSSGVSLSQSQPLQSWQPSAVSWLDVQASGAAALQSGSSQSAQTSGRVSFQPASSTPVDSVAQSGQTSVSQQTPSLIRFGSRPARLPSIASSGSAGSQMSPGLSASLKQPTGFVTTGSAAQGVSVSSQTPSDSASYGAGVGGQGMSSGSKSVLYSSYGSSSQSGPVSYSQASGSAGSQVSPGLFASLKQPTGFVTTGSAGQGVSVSSQTPSDSASYGAGVGGQGMSSGSKSVLYSSSGSSSSQSGPVSYSQSASGPSSPSQYTSLSQSRTGSLLTSSGYLSAPGGSGSSDGSSLLAQGTFGKYTPVASMDTRLPVFSQTKAVSSGVSLSQSQPLQSWQPSAVSWLDVQASGAAALPGGSSQSAQTSGRVSFQPASSTPVDSVAQSGQTSVSRQTPSLIRFGSRPARLPSIASSGSAGSQMSPGLSASLKQPTGSVTTGSAAQGESVSSQAQTLSDSSYGAGGQGMSSGLKYMLYSSYGSSSQSGPVSYRPVSDSAGSQASPGLFASLKLPTGSITPGSTAQPASGGMSSALSQAFGDSYGASVGGQGMSGSVSSGLTVSSSYGQRDPVFKPSQGSLRQYYAVKG